jgi:hypothetical protein
VEPERRGLTHYNDVRFCDQHHKAGSQHGAKVPGWRSSGRGAQAMKKSQPLVVVNARASKTPLERLHLVRDLNARKNRIQDITRALTLSGYTSLDQQAKALGLHRATAWTIIKNKHKLGRLSAKTIERIIANPATPPLVLAVIQEYVIEKHQSNTSVA